MTPHEQQRRIDEIKRLIAREDFAVTSFSPNRQRLSWTRSNRTCFGASSSRRSSDIFRAGSSTSSRRLKKASARSSASSSRGLHERTPATFVLRIQGPPDQTGIHALRFLLKRFHRQYGFRALDVREEREHDNEQKD